MSNNYFRCPQNFCITYLKEAEQALWKSFPIKSTQQPRMF